MTRRMVVIAAGVAAAGALLAVRLARPPAREEERVRAVFLEAAEAAEARKAGDVVARVSERFRGEGLDRRGVKQLVAFQLLRGEWVSVTITDVKVDVAGDVARANVDAVLSRAAGKGKALRDLLPGEATAHRFACRLEREDGEWVVVEARWRPIGLAEALAGTPPPEDPDGDAG